MVFFSISRWWTAFPPFDHNVFGLILAGGPLLDAKPPNYPMKARMPKSNLKKTQFKMPPKNKKNQKQNKGPSLKITGEMIQSVMWLATHNDIN